MNLLAMLGRILPSRANLPAESIAVREAASIIDRAEQVTAHQERETQRLQGRLDLLRDYVKADEIAPFPKIRGYDDHGGSAG